MGWPMGAAMGVSALGGMMGGKGEAQAANQPTVTDTQNTAWNPQMADQWAQGYQGAFDNALGNVQFGPRGYQQAMFQDLMGSAFGGGGRGGGGGGGRGISGAGSRSGGGRPGGGGGGIFKRLAGNNVAFNDYEKRVLGEGFMDWENNPVLQQRLDALGRENAEAQSRAMSEGMGKFVGAGGTMGLSGMMAAGRAKIADDYGENLANTQAGFMSDYDAQLRQQQSAANQAWSGRESTYDASGFQNHATRAAANAAAAAQRYSADQSLRGVLAGVRRASANDRFNQQLQVFGLGNQMHGLQQQGEGLGALSLYGQMGSDMYPYQSAFGSQHQTSTGPQRSVGNAGFSGFMSGLGSGYGIGKQFGFKGFD